MHKTCWYTTIHPLRVGAMVGSGGTADLAPFVRFGFHFGAAFQIRDDLLNLVGDEHDLRQGDPRRPLRGQAHADAGASAVRRPRARTARC